MEMPRVLIFDHLDNQVCELSPNDVFSLVRTEEINGQNSLEITSSQPLSKEQRVLVRDMMGTWREYVVTGVDESHLSGEHATGTYFCEWSLKHDLMGVTVIDKRPGVQTPVLAGVALGDLLSYTRRWAVGDVTVTATGGQSLYWISAWEGLGKIVDEWGGEAKAEIAVSPSGVISRRLSLLEAMGEQAAKRRFDFGYDLTGIQRKVEETPVYCRVYPRGKGEETGSGGFGRRITIESANNGVAYIENEDTAQVVRLPDGQGGYEYPSCVIENSEIDDPAALKAWAESVSDDYTTPKVTYTGSVEQFAAAGLDAKGVSLGDAVQCVDREFAPNAALRVNGRIVKIVVDERDPFSANLTIGYVSGGLASLFGDLGRIVRNTASAVEAMNGGTMSTADYLERLIDRINAEINATGGYTYIKPGEGIWIYDKEEDRDPSQVVRIMGGSISVANSKTSQGEWDWETMMTGRDGVLASAITAAELTSGFIGSADSGNYWNLDTGELRMASVAQRASKPNLSPFYSRDFSDVYDASSNPNGYWTNALADTAQGDDGWAHVAIDNSTGTGWRLSHVMVHNGQLPGGMDGATLLVEVRGFARQSENETYVGLTAQNQNAAYKGSVSFIGDGSYRLALTPGSASSPFYALNMRYEVPRQTRVEFDVRLSVYEGGYDGAYQPYVLSRGEIEGIAGSYASEAEESAKEYAASAASAAVNAQTQADIFNKLTDNGAIQGLYMSNGDIYLNGTYIKSGTIAAGLIRAGTITDAKGNNSWNLDTGMLSTEGMTATNLTLKNRRSSDGVELTTDNGVSLKWLDGAEAQLAAISPGTYVPSSSAAPEGALFLECDWLFTRRTSAHGSAVGRGFTGQVPVALGRNGSILGTVGLNFVNGLLVGDYSLP